jgi:polar amino acid transport system substrate-binding protein
VFTLRHVFAALFCLSLGCTSTSTAHPTTNSTKAEPAALKLRLASSSWPPWVGAEGQPRVALEIVSTALSRAGYIAIHDIAPLDQLLSNLRNGGGAYDGSASLWRSEEREQFLLYSESYLENRMVLVGPRGGDVSATSFSQLKGKRIGVVKDYAYGPELDGATEPVFVRGESTEANLHTLLRGGRGGLDYVLADALVVYHLKQQYPEKTQERLVTGSTPLITRSLHFALRKNLPNAQQILDRFNEERAKMLKDGSYHTALQVDWILADVDGDGIAEMVAGGEKLGVEAPKSGYQPVSISKGGVVPGSESKARYVVKGVPYDTWDTVPDSFKTPPNTPTGTKPGTLRATVFDF